MRPIDADKLLEEGYLECFEEKCTERDLAFLNMMVERMPTVEAVPVIRCKDCKYHHESLCENWNYISTDDDYFCKDGERKEE